MKIIQTPSANFDARTLPITLLVLHYTGMETGAAALERMRDNNPAEGGRVSAHYMVEEDGRIFQLVDEGSRAWHAGVSEWRGQSNINSASIGIEIVNGGHNFPKDDGSLPPFPDPQILAVIALSKAVMARHGISARGVVGHSDIAPTRKQDPGEHFPWAGLAAAGVGYFPRGMAADGEADGEADREADRRALFGAGSRDRGVAIIQRGLADIGYSARVSGVLDTETQLILAAVQRRYRPDLIDGLVDMETMGIVKALAEYNNAAA